MSWRDLLAATGAGLVAAAVALWLSLPGLGHDGGALAGLVHGLLHGLLHGVTLLAALIGLALGALLRLDGEAPQARLQRLHQLHPRRRRR